ncbi:putative tRNA/rRNA methyltransferase [Halomicronema hongdechloris C2206]|uniref:tRNA/rRNA methyltransferase n=1 Tax=Halomicronema hongdechloris C2206 TaxID=1641165 RepID=A0A1Z3HU46_9CYAN|nr:RNA methyltransferase [Halomicronema hongdechloris]ASC73795.1 putative tRNA/rRNA methyltransferase [Halomicronema hongdechloris C2206]
MLTSVKNPLVKLMRQLHQAKGRRQQQQFLLEGTHLLEEALAVQHPLTVVCSTPTWQTRYPELWQKIQAQTPRAETVSPEVLQAMATTVHPDGVVAMAVRHPSGNSHPDTDQAFSLTLGVAVETLQDPGNLGTMIRTAAAVAADGLWLSANSVDSDHPKVLRASAGQWFRLPLYSCADLTQQVNQWRRAGLQIIATQSQASTLYWELDLRQPTIILLGNEGAGLSPELVEAATAQACIPLAPSVESLNVAVTAALMLYEVRRQRLKTEAWP